MKKKNGKQTKRESTPKKRVKNKLSFKQIIAICTLLCPIIAMLYQFVNDVEPRLAPVKFTYVTNEEEGYKSLTTKVSINNLNVNSKRITDSYVEIEKITPMETSNLVLLAKSDSTNEFKIYAINNGQKNIDYFDTNLYFTNFDNEVENINVMGELDLEFSVSNLLPGEIRMVHELVFSEKTISAINEMNYDSGSFCAYTSFENKLSSPVCQKGNDFSFGVLYVYSDRISLDRNAKGGLGDEKTSYDQIYINVASDNKKKIHFYTNPIIDGHLDLISEIFPDKSCNIEYSIHYIFDNEIHLATEKLYSRVYIPKYGDNFVNSKYILNRMDNILLQNAINEEITNYFYGESSTFQEKYAYDRDKYSMAKYEKSK